MSFCYNCGVRRLPNATVCEKCGIQFDDKEHLAPALPEWGSLILDPPPVRCATDNRQAEDTQSRSEKLLDRKSGSAQPTAKEEIEEPPAFHQDVPQNSDQKSLPDYANYYSGRMLDDVLSDYRSSDAELELELDAPIRERRKLDKKKSREMARARFEQRIRTIGNFGYARLGFVNGALYSARVLWRRFVLRFTLRRLKTTRAKAFAEAQCSLRDLGEVMYTMRDSEKMQPYRKAVQAILRADKEIDDTHTAQKQTLDSTYETMRKIMQEIEDIHTDDKRLRAEESRLRDSLNEQENAQQSFEAAIYEIQEKLAALQPDARKSSDVEVRAALDAQMNIKNAKLQAVQKEIADLNDALQIVHEERAYKNARLDAIRERRKSITQNRERSDQVFEKNFEESGNARDRALRALARIVLANKPKGIATKQITDSEVAVKKLKIANLKVEMYNRALDVYNPHVFRRGLYYLCSIAVLLIFLGVGVAFTLNGSTGKQIEIFLVDNLRSISQQAQGESDPERSSVSAPEPKAVLSSNDTQKETSIAVRGSDARDPSKKSGLEKMRDSLEDLQAKVKQRNETLKKLEKGELY